MFHGHCTCSYYSSQYQKTALHYASKGGHHDTVRVLLQSRAHPNVRDHVSIYVYVANVLKHATATKHTFLYVIDNVHLECITGFTVTRGVVKSIIQHEAQSSTMGLKITA